MRVPGLLLAMAFVTACGGGEPPTPEDGPPPLYKYASMKSAVADAQETLPVFWNAAESGNPDYSDFALNVVTASPRYTQEHVWLIDVRQDADGSYRGIIPETHEIDDGLTPSQVIAFQPEHIADWRFKDDGRFRGAYTMRAMLELAPGADIENIRSMFHDSPVP